MSDVNHTVKLQSSGLSLAPGSSRRPRRPNVTQPDGAANSDALLTALDQQLKGINEGITRANVTLYELVQEMKSLRPPAPDETSV